jgi:hypothetical protein
MPDKSRASAHHGTFGAVAVVALSTPSVVDGVVAVSAAVGVGADAVVFTVLVTVLVAPPRPAMAAPRALLQRTSIVSFHPLWTALKQRVRPRSGTHVRQPLPLGRESFRLRPLRGKFGAERVFAVEETVVPLPEQKQASPSFERASRTPNPGGCTLAARLMRWDDGRG